MKDLASVVVGVMIGIAVTVFVEPCAPVRGTLRGACYPNATCDEGLVCVSEVCVAAPPPCPVEEK